MIIWLASYPRSGNSLLANLLKHHFDITLYSIYKEAGDLKIYTSLNRDELQSAAKSPDVFFVKTHELPADDFPAIYVVRDGRDAITSYAHYILDNQINLPVPPPENPLIWALDALVNSSDQFGGWGEHVLSWANRASKTIVVHYEELIQKDCQQKIIKSAIADLELNNFQFVTDSSLPDFDRYHQTAPTFYRKGQAGSWAVEMPHRYHLMFWERYGYAMQMLGYKKNSDQDLIRSEFVVTEVLQDLEQKIGHISRLTSELNGSITTNQKLIDEFLQAQSGLNQALAEKDALEMDLRQQIKFNHDQSQSQIKDLQDSVAQIISAKEQELAAKEQELAALEAVKEQELAAKEQVIQKFRHSLSYSLQHGPFRYLPLIARLHRGWEQIQEQIRGIRRQLFTPHLGVLYQYSPKPSDLPERYFKVDKLTQPAPTISIVTPAYNYAHFLERTLKSVISQGYPELEYVIQDGGSTDNTVELVNKFKRHLKHFESRPDNGQTHAINLGFQHTKGEIMAYLNADDVLLPGTLDYVANYFSKHPEVDVVYGHRLIIDGDDQVLGDWIMPAHDGEALRWADYIPQETLFWRRRIWEKVGGLLDESFHFAMDWDLLLRFQEAGAVFERLPRFLAAFRVHTQQKTSSQLTELGEREVNKLRLRNFGRIVDYREINRNLHTFLKRSIQEHWIHKSGIKFQKFVQKFRRKSEPVSWYEPESVYFYSLHKAGTSLLTHFLRQSDELVHVDYETMLFDNKLPEEIIFRKYGHLYGVFRVITNNKGKQYKKLGKFVFSRKSVRGKTIVFLVRDPRDILISYYYLMFYNTHVANGDPEIEAIRQAKVRQIQLQSLDEAVLGQAQNCLERFELLYELSSLCKHRVILKYEDMVNNFDIFIRDFSRYISIPEDGIQEWFHASRPREIEDPSAHKRSGKTQQYKEKLKPETIRELNQILKPVLEKFGYSGVDEVA